MDRRRINADRAGKVAPNSECEEVAFSVGEFLLGKNPVLVDGEAVKPILDRSNYIKVGMRGIQLLEKPERLETASAIIGVIITYITDGIPQEVTVDWELFTDQIRRVPATSTDPAGPLPTFLVPENNVHTWTNFLKNYQLPTVQAVSVAGSLGSLSIPLLTLACSLLGLAVLVLTIYRQRRGSSITIPVTGFVLLVIIGTAAFPYSRVSIERPMAMAGTLEPEQARELLQVLLKKREEDKHEMQENVLSNIRELVTPYLMRLQRSRLDPRQQTLMEILQANLDNIISPFISKLSSRYLKFTPAEIRVSNLIKEGKTNKEIAEVLLISKNTVLFHRHNIRTKLGLKNKKINLRTHLLSYEE